MAAISSQVLLPDPPVGKTGWPWSELHSSTCSGTENGRIWPRISVVTPSFNQGRFLEETIRSVLGQGYPNLEYIIIDGGSTDESISVIKKYEPWLSYWVSEPDRGQTHAINKGLQQCTGDIFAYINSDDYYFPSAFFAVVEWFRSHPSCMWLVGDMSYTGANSNQAVRAKSVVARSFEDWLAMKTHMPQPATFWRRSILGTGFEECWNYCLDVEMAVRLLSEDCLAEHLPQQLAAFRLHTDSKTYSGNGFIEELCQILTWYEPRLNGRTRRASKCNRFFRYAIESHRAGNHVRPVAQLAAAAFVYPRILCDRQWWGQLRATLSR